MFHGRRIVVFQRLQKTKLSLNEIRELKSGGVVQLEEIFKDYMMKLYIY